MNKKIKVGSLALCASLGLMAQAQATMITGDLSFSGGVTLNSSGATATQVNSFSLSVVSGDGSSPAGDFVGFVAPGAAVTMAAPWVFTAAQPSLWSVGGFTFDLNAGAAVGHFGNAVTVIGTGTISGHGFTPTPGEYIFSAQNVSSSFSFSSSTGATPTPDAGTTLALLGLGMMGLGTIRHKLA